MAKKKPSPSTKSLQKTKLIMKAKHENCQKADLTVDFKPGKKDSLYENFKDLALFPIFNTDRKYFTPTFVLRFHDAGESDEELRNLHQKKMAEYTTEIQSGNILVPKPRSRNKYCGVCKDVYEDYYEHIHSQDHRQQARTSRFSKYINQLCVKFNPHMYKQPRQVIENELRQLMYRYKNQDHGFWPSKMPSHEPKQIKTRKESNLVSKKENSISCSNNNKTTIILSSD